MAEPYLSEIKMVGFNFAPRGWADCYGQMLEITQNQSLFSLLGATFGGDGRTTFALPDMRGRVPVHRGGWAHRGRKAGAETVTLTAETCPNHTHDMYASGEIADNWAPYSTKAPQRALGTSSVPIYTETTNQTVLSAQSVATSGGSQPHNNMQPFLAIRFIIATQGLFPSRN